MYSRETTVINEIGLHARPASAFVSEAIKFTSDVNLLFMNKSYNAKSIMKILSMGAKKGAKIKIEADGADEVEAVTNLVHLVESGFGEI